MTLLKKIETLFAAVAFAEAGEHETAKQLVQETNDNNLDNTKSGHSGIGTDIRISPSRV